MACWPPELIFKGVSEKSLNTHISIGVMAFDFKKEYKEFYLPPVTPTLVDVPPSNYIAVRGVGKM